MTLKAVYSSVDDVPEALRDYYPETDGKFVFVGAEGWKTQADVDKVSTALVAERKLAKQFKDSASVWESKLAGKNPDEVVALLERIPQLEAESQGKIDNKKLGEIVETTARQRMAPLEHEINKLKQAVNERETEIATFKAADRRRTIHDAVRAVAAKEGFQENTYSNPEGALMLLAERHLTINSIGDVVVSEDSRTYTPGLPIREALGEIKNQHSYMLKQSVGGGATGGAGGTSGTNPFKTNNLTERGKFVQENKNNPQRVLDYVKAAGLSHPHELHKDR